LIDITADITVYRYSSTKHLEYLQKKVANLEQSHALHSSRTITRSLAKDGLMEDGKENLLKSAYVSRVVQVAFIDAM